MFVMGSIYDNIVICFCVVVKRYIYVYELNWIKYRYLKIKVNLLMYIVVFFGVSNVQIFLLIEYFVFGWICEI